MEKRPAVRLRLFGHFAVATEGEPPRPIRISSKKACALLAYLCLEGGTSREQLATLLWGEQPDSQARHNLRQAILSLRKDLAGASDLLTLENDLVGLRMDRLTVDVLDFEELARSMEVEELERAAGLYGGGFLSGLTISAEVFEDWLRAKRIQLKATAARVFEMLADRLDITGQSWGAIDTVERLVALDPLREDWQRRALRIYQRHQGRDAALARAKVLVASLKKELDVDPEPDTKSLIDEIRRSVAERTEHPENDAPQRRIIAQPPQTQVPSADVANQLPPSHSDRIVLTVPQHAPRRDIPPFAQRNRKFLPMALLLLAVFGLSWGLAERFLRPTVDLDSKTAGRLQNTVPIAILHLETPNQDESAQSIAAAISEDLTNLLPRIANVRVLSRLTSLRYRRQAKNARVIGDELGVRYLLDGSLRIAGEKVHVNVELVDATSGLQVWSNQFERDGAGSSATIEEIVRRLAREVELEMTSLNSERLTRHDSIGAGVEGLLAVGWNAIFHSATEDSLPRAEAAFREASRRDPDGRRAMLGLAAHHIIAVGNLVAQREPYLSEAEQLLDRLSQRYPDWSSVHYYRGLLLKLRGELKPALASFARSVELNPSIAPAYGQMGQTLAVLGRIGEGLDRIQYAMRVSPQEATMASWAIFAGCAELERGNDEAGFELLFRAIALNPNSRLAHGSLAAAYALDGDQLNASRHAAKFKALTSGVANHQRLALFGAFLPPSSPHRVADGLRMALAKSE